jgi:hypothetical protein
MKLPAVDRRAGGAWIVPGDPGTRPFSGAGVGQDPIARSPGVAQDSRLPATIRFRTAPIPRVSRQFVIIPLLLLMNPALLTPADTTEGAPLAEALSPTAGTEVAGPGRPSRSGICADRTGPSGTGRR